MEILLPSNNTAVTQPCYTTTNGYIALLIPGDVCFTNNISIPTTTGPKPIFSQLLTPEMRGPYEIGTLLACPKGIFISFFVCFFCMFETPI
jgi:hypothetical protein